MEDIFVVVPTSVTLKDVGDVLRRFWKLEDERDQPSVRLDRHKWAYVAELDRAELDDDPLFFDPGEREVLKERVGDYRMLSVRYGSPELARDMARAIASSELAEGPMLISPDGPFMTPQEFLESERWGGGGRTEAPQHG